MDKYKLVIEENGPKYLQIYNHIKKMITNNEIGENKKLPPIRSIAKFLSVNNTTIVKAYELLEKEGYVYKIIGSGTFVSDTSVKNKSNDKMSMEGIIRFDNGNPSIDMFPVEEFKKSINIALEKEGNSMFEYDDGLGFTKLREKLVEYLKTLNIKTTRDNIQIISGAQQGIDIVCKGLINYSDLVFVEEPTYRGALEVFKNRGSKIISIPMLEDGIDIGILKLKLEKIRPKILYTMPNYQNPTGISYSEYKKKKLIELAEKYDFYILEDDFMSDLRFTSTDHFPLRSYDDKGRVIYIKSFSKLLMPGIRIGLVEMPNEILHKILWAKYSSDISTSGIIQRSMYYYMENFNWINYIKSIENAYYEKFKLALELIQNKLGDKLKIKIPTGGINFFLELPRGYSAKAFSKYLRKKGVAILSGGHFFDTSIDDRFFRINIAQTSLYEIQKGIDIISDNIDEFLKNYKNIEEFKENKLFF
ncbi:PLP-dependent aminotransferase family protein [Paraclostridium ghonii]|uniref:DNA-binding transcriptional MocR family regulator n=1 Tax=Paraclostridium ghonii TaxID=29358 RepID=A0ABU0N1L6_9FIRM|nr:PLP-dependent aminotransferase family protein [Paeniclostridium ghonii]MDQ0556869.1 DNA-binding transcriptional MocR family regulator [Paeniclostridium ghonii]